jgi:hypothetical protein
LTVLKGSVRSLPPIAGKHSGGLRLPEKAVTPRAFAARIAARAAATLW